MAGLSEKSIFVVEAASCACRPVLAPENLRAYSLASGVDATIFEQLVQQDHFNGAPVDACLISTSERDSLVFVVVRDSAGQKNAEETIPVEKEISSIIQTSITRFRAARAILEQEAKMPLTPDSSEFDPVCALS